MNKMLRLFFVLSFYVISSVVINATEAIRAMIEANSNVRILEVVNDASCPFEIVGKDSLKSTCGVSTLMLCYESDSICLMDYTKLSYSTFYVDGVERANSDVYLPIGKHWLKLEFNNSRRNDIIGFGVNGVVGNEDLIRFIQEKSDVEILSFKNDSLSPWYLTEAGEMVCQGDETMFKSGYHGFELSFKSDSIVKFMCDLRGGRYSTWEMIVNRVDTLIGVRNSFIYLYPGEYTIEVRCDAYWDYTIEELSVRNVCVSEDIKNVIEANSDVEVEIVNDTRVPLVLLGTDSIVSQGMVYADCDSITLMVKYNSPEVSIVSFDFNRDDCKLYVDGKYCNFRKEYWNSKIKFALPAGSHTIQFVNDVVIGEFGFEEIGNVNVMSDYIIGGLEIRPIAPLEQVDMSLSIANGKENYYDVDGDGEMEWLKGSSSTLWLGMDWLNFASCEDVKFEGDKNGYLIKWMNLTNDAMLDAYSNDTYSKHYVYKADANYNLEELLINAPTSGVVFPMDYDNDGYMDLISYLDNGSDLDNDRAFTLRNNGVEENRVSVMTIDEYGGKSLRKYRGSFMKTSGIPSLRNGMIIKGGKPITKAMSNMNMDIDGDGVMDYFEEGNVYFNKGEGMIVYDEFPEGLDFVELNDDGVLDGVAFDGANVVIYTKQNDGTYAEQKIYASAQYTKLWCYDFDKDNDKDILLVFNYSDKLAGSYLILLENKAGKYTSHEYFYEKSYNFDYCVDYDADGYYEIIAKYLVSSNENRLVSFDVDGVQISETPKDLNFILSRGGAYDVVDLNNDGRLEVLGNNKYMILSEVANERPTQPQAPSVVYDASASLLSITWEQGEDKETSSVDLTYALRIGTEPGKGDVVYAHALSDGTRRNRLGGNQNVNRYRLLNTNTWKAGKYYISIQVVDLNDLGSLFSEEVVFEKENCASAFEMLYKMPFGVGDTCEIHLHENVLLDTTHYLRCEDAIVVDKSNDGRVYKVVFTGGGEKLISLYTNGGFNVLEKYIEVGAISAGRKITQMAYLDVDLDEDGLMEYLVKSEGFYSYGVDGEATKINKMWNNHNYLSNSGTVGYVLDVNKDGQVDVYKQIAVQSYGAGAAYATILNSGNKNMMVNTDEISLSFRPEYFIDFDNDGNIDYTSVFRDMQTGITIYYLCRNLGNYTEYQNYPLNIGEPMLYRDLTKDGLVDILVKNTEGTQYIYELYENNGNFSFTKKDTLFTHTRNELVSIIEDLDNDGTLDLIYKSESKYYIAWSDGRIDYLDGITSVKNSLFDFNNDGYLDVVATGGINDVDGVLLILPNRAYDFVEGVEVYMEKAPFITPQGEMRFDNTLMRIANMRPNAPSNLNVGYREKAIEIVWNHSRDAETPECRMRYNISLKHKGKDGEGAYFISPCNSTKNGVHLPTSLNLLETNRISIPITSIPVGEYEVCVQGVDMQNQESDFSEVLEFVVNEKVIVDAPAVTGVGIETQIKIVANTQDTIDWGGGQVIHAENDCYIVAWDSVGVKTITMGDYKHSIYVSPLPNASFDLPSSVMQYATVGCVIESVNNDEWFVASGEEAFTAIEYSDIVDLLSTKGDTAIFVFNQVGKYKVRRIVYSGFGNVVFDRIITVTGDHITPNILHVTTIDGHNKVVWEKSATMPTDVVGIRIYKETSFANVFNVIGEVGVDNQEYIDLMSNSTVQASRYAISYITTYGESKRTNVHQAPHVMINGGMNGAWNLVWTKYEGRDVSQYRILRGSDINKMTLIGEVSGNMNTYTDLTANDGVNYYAVEVVFAGQKNIIKHRKTKSLSSASISNIVSTDVAHRVSFVETIDVQGLDIVAGINLTSQLKAYVYPYYSTYKSVNWVIEQGNDFATISKDGLLSVDGETNGIIVVRAYALDGSGVYGEAIINVSGFKKTYNITYYLDNEVWQTQACKEGDAIELLETPTKEGYNFVGWTFINEEGDTTTIPTIMPSHDIALYGYFEQIIIDVEEYTITYMLDDTIWQIQTYEVGDTITLLEAPTKENHNFIGWNYLDENGELSVLPTIMPNHNIVVSGYFEPIIISETDIISSDEKKNKAYKILIDGRIYILKDSQIYTISGQKLKSVDGLNK